MIFHQYELNILNILNIRQLLLLLKSNIFIFMFFHLFVLDIKFLIKVCTCIVFIFSAFFRIIFARILGLSSKNFFFKVERNI